MIFTGLHCVTGGHKTCLVKDLLSFHVVISFVICGAENKRHGQLVPAAGGRDSAGALRGVPGQPGGASVLLALQQV